ncbi:UPF0389 protein CG9231 [Rhynchophorus ferrugineus]|uniref:Uncharacterized protein n=2 Tax=Rhynchophorus ferrugineus TaxID=354439 RepID=A0A834I2I1_RHYFE|nr:hypothetical protein GWI33_015654 [Rhynchophorus ferrugineus]
MSSLLSRVFQTTKFNGTNVVPKRSYTDLDKLQAPHKVNNWERRFLVWTGKYKTLDEVPSFVSQSVMERTRNRMRIRIANYMMLATVVGCLTMVYLGKQDAKEGKSIIKQNLEWHRKIKEEEIEKQLAAKETTN